MPARTWGDGATDRRLHVIEDIHYGEGGPSTLACRCGTEFLAATPEALSAKWRAHGGKVLDHSDIVERGQLPTPGEVESRRVAAYSAIAALGALCTCPPVELCPNYVRGD